MESQLRNGRVLNLGCGARKVLAPNVINVDAYECCKPDVVWDLNKTPMPFAENSVDHIVASHVFEHLPNWWECFCDCARILKPGGLLEIWVPGPGDAVRGFRDHVHEINLNSFYGTYTFRRPGTNAWAKTESMKESAAHRMKLVANKPVVSNSNFRWMPVFMLELAAHHLRNVVKENGYFFEKMSEAEYEAGENHYKRTGRIE